MLINTVREFTKNRKSWIPWIIALIPAFVLRLHNALTFNTYWGYDGGAHTAYIRSLGLFGLLPTMEENYLAWHEPLFYIVMAPFYVFVRIQASEAITNTAMVLIASTIGILFVVLAAFLTWQLTRNRIITGIALLFFAYLPLFVFISQYVTNEMPAQALMLGVLVILASKKLSLKKAVIAGLLIALAILTKLTGLVLLLAIIIWAAYKLFFCDKDQRWTQTKTLALLILIPVVLSAPWFVYRTKIAGHATVLNVYEDGESVAEHDLPTFFFFNFNTEILNDPFWDSGSDGFWSILFAQTFSDYDNRFLHVDRSYKLPFAEKYWMFGGSWLPLWRSDAARRAIIFAFPIAILGAIGVLLSLGRLFTEKTKHRPILLLWIFFGGTLASLVYNVSRYPFLERGTLKAAFGLTGIAVGIILALMGLNEIPFIKKRPWILPALILPFFAVYVIFAWPMLWV